MNFISKYKNMPSPARAAIWFVICNVVNKGLSLLATPILTRIMTTDQYGTFSVFQSWVSIMTVFCTLNLFGSVYSRGRLDFRGSEIQFESSLLGLSSVLTLAFFGIFCMAPTFWAEVMGLSPFLIVLLFVEIALMSATSFWSARQRFEYRYRALVFVTIASNIFSLGAGIIAILNTDAKVEARVIMDVIAKGIPGILLMVLIFARGKCLFRKEYWKYGISLSVPLLPHFLSHYVLNQSDRLMISQIVNNSAAALYSVSYSIAMALVIVVTAINDSYCPYTFQELDDGRIDGVRKSGYLVLLLVGALTVMIMAFAPEVLSVFAGPEYSDAVDIIPPLSASVFFIFFYSMMSNLEYFYKKTGLIAIASVASAVLNIGLNLVLIPTFGYKAAAWTTLASYMMLAFMHWAFSARICRIELGRQVYSSRYLLLAVAVVLIVTLGMDLIYGMVLVRYLILLIITVCLFVKRHEIFSVVRKRG